MKIENVGFIMMGFFLYPFMLLYHLLLKIAGLRFYLLRSLACASEIHSWKAEWIDDYQTAIYCIVCGVQKIERTEIKEARVI